MVATHENPDGDALGSLVAMHALLKTLGKDVEMFMRRERPAAARRSTAGSRSKT